MNLPDLRCTLIRGKYSQPEAATPYTPLEVEMHNRTYRFWKSFWTQWAESTEGVSSGAYVQVDNFLKHELHLLIHSNTQGADGLPGDILASMSLSVLNLDLDATYDLAYLRDYPTHVLQEFRAQAQIAERRRRLNSTLAITGEYLCVHPDFRKHQMGVSLADIMVGLNMEMFKSMHAAFALGTGLNRVKMPECCYQYGFEAVGSLLKCNLECTALVNRASTVRKHPDLRVAQWIDRIWEQRLDLTQGLFWPKSSALEPPQSSAEAA